MSSMFIEYIYKESLFELREYMERVERLRMSVPVERQLLALRRALEQIRNVQSQELPKAA